MPGGHGRGMGGSRVRKGGLIAAGLLALSGCAGRPAPARPPSLGLLPVPASVVPLSGSVKLGPTVSVPPGDAGARNAAEWLVELARRTGGPTLRVVEGGPATVRFARGPGRPPEGYRLEAARGAVLIEAGDDAGLLHGATTLWQLAGEGARVPAVRIEDAPRFPWRGLMLDSARHFQSPAFVKSLIDAMAAHKLNVLHWHLVDDQGWRIEIAKYPRLTEVGAFRRPATAPGAPPLPATGGFYSQADIRDIVAHATRRGVQVVPEIEMPGHALSAIRAYPRLGTGAPVPPGVESHWGVFPWLYNVDDATFGFLNDVLSEVTALFPGRYIHVGGDEAVKDQWRASPAVQARMRALGLKDEVALQSWFMARIGRFLAARGRKLVGWDEILEGGLAPGATVMSWRGVDGAAAAAKAGHDAVLSPAPTLYLNHLQGAGSSEGPGRGGVMSLGTVYAFEPVPADLAPELRRHILGLQGNLWTEHARGEARAAHMLFPRASAVAEIGWSPKAARDLPGFVRRLAPQMDRIARLGLVAAPTVFAPVATERLDRAGTRVAVTLAAEAGLPIRYTLDGTAPGPRSPLYAAPLSLALPTRLRAASFDGARALPGALDRRLDGASVRRRTDRELRGCANKVPLALEDDWPAAGPRASFLIDILQPCWIFAAAPLDGVRRIAIEVGQVPFNFQVGKDRDAIRFRPPATPAGEFEVRAGGCAGERIAVLPLAPAAANPGVTRLLAPIVPRTGAADLCVTYTARGPDPLWAVTSVQLVTE